MGEEEAAATALYVLRLPSGALGAFALVGVRLRAHGRPCSDPFNFRVPAWLYYSASVYSARNGDLEDLVGFVVRFGAEAIDTVYALGGIPALRALATLLHGDWRHNQPP